MNKKKIIYSLVIPLSIILIVFGIGGFLNSKAGSEDFVVSNGILTKYSGSEQIVKIPSNVTVIGQDAFSGNPVITSVEIPFSVTRIDNNAFSNCINLQGIDIPDSVTSIGESAFNGDTALVNVSVGSNVQKLGSGSFAGCNKLADVRFKGSNFICKDGAIYNPSMTKLYQYLAGYPGNVYNMPDTIKDIERYTFWGADKLNQINLSPSLDKLPEYSVANCTGLTNIVGHVPLREIGLGAFHGDTALLQVVMPESMINIHNNAFDGCPSDLIFVCDEGTYAFDYANEHGYLTSMDEKVNVENNNLTIANVPSNGSNNTYNPTTSGNSLNDLYGQLFGDENSNNSNENQNTSYQVVPNNNTIQPGKPFQGLDYLDDENATRVAGDKAFIAPSNLKVVDGSEAIQREENEILNNKINDYMYYNAGFTSFDFPEDIKSIGVLSFARSNLKEVVIPQGVSYIGYGAFYHCDNLENVIIPTTVKVIDDHAFEYTAWYNNWLNDTASSDYLIVGDGVLLGYKGSKENFIMPENIKYVCKSIEAYTK